MWHKKRFATYATHFFTMCYTSSNMSEMLLLSILLQLFAIGLQMFLHRIWRILWKIQSIPKEWGVWKWNAEGRDCARRGGMWTRHCAETRLGRTRESRCWAADTAKRLLSCEPVQMPKRGKMKSGEIKNLKKKKKTITSSTCPLLTSEKRMAISFSVFSWSSSAASQSKSMPNFPLCVAEASERAVPDLDNSLIFIIYRLDFSGNIWVRKYNKLLERERERKRQKRFR